MIYIHKSEKHASGFKAWKDRPRLVLCGNATGHIMKPGFVYPAKNPRALKNKKNLSVFWQNKLNAWVMAVSVTEWVFLCFIPEVKKYLEKQGLPLQLYC
jgi:hypothetical protein